MIDSTRPSALLQELRELLNQDWEMPEPNSDVPRELLKIIHREGRRAFKEGFNQSCEGWNSECGGGSDEEVDKLLDIEYDKFFPLA